MSFFRYLGIDRWGSSLVVVEEVLDDDGTGGFTWGRMGDRDPDKTWGSLEVFYV